MKHPKAFKAFSLKLLLASIIMTVINTQCEKNSVDQLSLLPKETSIGANTFGCLSNGIALVAKDGQNLGQWCWTCGTSSIGVTTSYDNFDSIANSLDIMTSDSKAMEDKSPSGFYMTLHFVHLYKIKNGQLLWQFVQDFGTYGYYLNNYIEGEFYVDSLKGYAWFDSYDSSGVTFINRCDTLNRIISGTFNGNLRIRNGTRQLKLTNGRFDIKW